ncbi:hypothetical protein OF83DRAFT_935562 [Amylostereum chailletii]|nr:hypothetical protein OF83DRAFT_935562 [Amylostereum chailletii]
MTKTWHSDHPAHSSQLSQSRGFDTFIFWPSLPAARLFMGLNSEKMGPTSVSQLTRWISIWDPDFVEFYGPIKIHRVNLKDAYYPLEYIAEHFGPPLELSDAVTPGDYGIFPGLNLVRWERGNWLTTGIGPIVDFTRIPGPSPHIVNRRPLDIEHERLVTMARNFDLAKDGSKEDIDLLNAGLELNSMSADLIATVKEHNPLETCIFTGETAGTVISWIFPPALVRLVSIFHLTGPSQPSMSLGSVSSLQGAYRRV